MHIHAEKDMSEYPEIFECESIKEIEKGRNSDWSKEYFIKQKAETLEVMTSQLAAVLASVEAQEEVLDTLNEQTEVNGSLCSKACRNGSKKGFYEVCIPSGT